MMLTHVMFDFLALAGCRPARFDDDLRAFANLAERLARPSEWALQMSELAMITGDQIRQARKLLGWHRGQIAIRARGITGNTVGKAEGAYPGKPPSPEQLAEIRAVLEAAGVEFTDGDPAGVRLKSPALPRAL